MLIVILFSLATEAQLTRIVFKKWGIFFNNYFHNAGDQNRDGISDFVLFNAHFNATLPDGTGDLEFYAGGPTLDTVPFFKLRGLHETTYLVDLNGDEYKDIMFMREWISPNKISIYYGGPLLDTIVDAEIPILSTFGSNYGVKIMNSSFHHKIDFNGDGEEELLIWDFRKTVYFLKTGSDFSGVPFKTLTIDIPEQDVLQVESFGDLNGDGCTDIQLYWWNNSPMKKVICVIYGNPQFTFNDRFTYSVNSDGSAQVGDFGSGSRIIADMNGDGKDDWLHGDWTHQYPSFFGTHKMTNGGYPPHENILGYRRMAFGSDASPGEDPPYNIGDINGDGYQDAVFNANSSSIYLFTGGPPVSEGANQKFYSSGWSNNSIMGGKSVIGDVTGDGIDDLALTDVINLGGRSNGFAVIYAGDTTWVTTSVKEENEKLLPTNLSLEAYPNPFNPTTKIKYTISAPGIVNLSIYNVSGELIEKRELGEMSTGSYEEEINLGSKNAASGIYFAEITLKSGSEVKSERVKLQLLK